MLDRSLPFWQSRRPLPYPLKVAILVVIQTKPRVPIPYAQKLAPLAPLIFPRGKKAID